MKIQGKITHVTPVEYVGQNQLAKRSARIVTDPGKEPKFEQSIAFDLLWDAADLITEDSIGSSATVSLNTVASEPNEQTGRMYNNFRAWKVDIETANQASDEDEDLPF